MGNAAVKDLRGTRPKRRKKCPVRRVMVTEYLFHHSELRRMNQEGQARIEDSKINDVITLAGQLEADGQDLGGCVLSEKGWKPLVLWGNTRERAAARLEAENKTIKGLDPGYLWMSYYNHPPSMISEHQAIENNIHRFSKSATVNDNVQSLLNMIASGRLDATKKYKDMNDVEQKAQVIAAAKRTHMPSSSHQTLWNKIRKFDQATQDKMRAWEKHELATYFGNNNDYGIDPDELKGFTQSCDWHLESDKGETIGLYFILNAPSATATMAQCHIKRNLLKKVDKIVLVCSINSVNSSGVQKSRKSVIAAIRKWNPSVVSGKVVDRVMFVPQTEAEQKKQLVAGNFIKDTNF